MIQHFKSQKLTTLSDKLAELMDAAGHQHPFEPDVLIVPNLETARWLKHEMAEKNGFAGNLEFLLPAEWQWKMVRRLYPELPKLLPTDPGPLKWTFAGLLQQEEIVKKFPLLRRYILSRPAEAREKAVIQLSGQLASVFDQYIVYRPEMLREWATRGVEDSDVEYAWQADLWKRVSRGIKSRGLSHPDKTELYHETLRMLQQGELNSGERLYLFNTGLVSQPFIRLISAAAKGTEIVLFTVQPSGFFQQNRNELIQAFGQEAEQSSKVYSGLNANVTALFDDEYPDSVLGNIQRRIVNGTTIGENELSKKPMQIEIRSCHSTMREIETLHQFLQNRFERDDTLTPDDILVITPNPDRYKQAIRAVFEQSDSALPEIPYHLGGGASDPDGVKRAVQQLLQLADSRFRFQDVMDLFQSAPIRRKLQISESDAARVQDWMKENHVVWGIDPEHREEAGQPAEAKQTWKRAFRNGWLGQLTSPGEESILFRGIYSTDQQELWAVFSEWFHELNVVRQQVRGSRAIASWCNWFDHVLGKVFPADALAESAGLQIRQSLQKLKESAELSAADFPVSFETFRDELLAHLQQIGAGGAIFSRGVIFSSMVPVRSIPFRVIALIGMNENEFPRKPASPDYDLMSKYPQPGERNRKSEDRNLFLESVMAAGELHYCSFIGQSQTDNEPIPPSPVISEWAVFLLECTGRPVDEIIKKEALNDLSPVNYMNGSSNSRTGFNALQIILGDEEPEAGLRITTALPEPDEEPDSSLYSLVAFYKNPLQWFLRNRMGVHPEYEDADKDEFVLDNLEAHDLFKRIFGWKLRGFSSDQIHSLLTESGTVPSGWPGDLHVRETESAVNEAFRQIKKMGYQPKTEILECSLSVGDFYLDGELLSYTDETFLDINPSRFSGKNAVQSWIHYLCWVAASAHREKMPAWFLCELKKGSPKRFRYLCPEEPLVLLEEMMDLFFEGASTPQLFFPSTVYEYITTELEKNEDQAVRNARATFEGGYIHFGERDNQAAKTLLGAEAAFSDRLLDQRYKKIMRTMHEHMEEG